MVTGVGDRFPRTGPTIVVQHGQEQQPPDSKASP